MPIVRVNKNNAGTIAGIFKSSELTGIKSYLGKYMGEAWTGSAADSKWAIVKNGDIYFLGGDPAPAEAEQILSDNRIFNAPENAVLIDVSRRWRKSLETVFGGLLSVRSRFAVTAGKNGFDVERLARIAATVPKGYHIKPIDRELYYRCLSETWSADFCSQFENADDYSIRGLGFAAMDGDKLVSGASSYFVYEGGIEIQTDTRENHRRRGLATACCAALIARCIESELYPSWDAANKISLSLAEKLGYSLEKEYETYALKPAARKFINRIV